VALPEYVTLWPLCQEWAEQSKKHPAEILAALCEHHKSRRLSLKFFRRRMGGAYQGHLVVSGLLPALAAFVERNHTQGAETEDAIAAISEIDVAANELLILCQDFGIRPPPSLIAETGRLPWIGKPHNSPIAGLDGEALAMVREVERLAREAVARKVRAQISRAPKPIKPLGGARATALPNEHEARKSPEIDQYRTGAAGRPSIMHLVEAEFQRRVDNGTALPVLRQEASELSAWARREHPEAPPVTAKTIENQLRAKHRREFPAPK
jgi:hypothetical protein